jgi:predicted nucleic acid-binding protein
MSRYLLDVNALVALGVREHALFERVVAWVQTLSASRDEFATCAVTELGFIRVLTQAGAHYSLSIAEAKAALQRLKASGEIPLTFIADDQDASKLPAWVKTSRQTTDGHLAQLAESKNAQLATLDRGIPGALLIPE